MPGVDELIIRGDVMTLDPARPRAGWIVVRDGIVAELYDDGPDRGLLLPDGACVLPGFTDAHAHLLSWASSLREVPLQDTRSLAEVLARVAAAEPSRSGWIRGFGWSAEEWTGGGSPSLAALDAVSGDAPVALLAHDWHSLWVNSAALALAEGSLEVPGGVVERDADGSPTGVLREESAWAFRDRYVLPPPEELLDALRAALPEASARGVVGVHDKDGMLGCVAVVAALREADGELPLRVWHSQPAAWLDSLGEGPSGSVGYVKAFMDGTLGSRTARLIGGGGVEVTSRSAFAEIVRRAAASGWPVAVHAIGDQAVRDALDAFSETADVWRPRGLRQRIEHAQCVEPSDAGRFAALGVTASIQPAMAVTDQALAERLWPERISRAYAYRTLRDAGARLAGGSDAPVEALDPLDGMRCAVLRTRDSRPPWRVEEALDLDTVLRAWTAVPAWLEGAEAVRGRLAPGMAADLVVLDRDPALDLAGARVIGTLVAGRWVHRDF
jgi:predicted amidohydrolase YtcJ